MAVLSFKQPPIENKRQRLLRVTKDKFKTPLYLSVVVNLILSVSVMVLILRG